jgi:hypothetical protein
MHQTTATESCGTKRTLTRRVQRTTWTAIPPPLISQNSLGISAVSKGRGRVLATRRSGFWECVGDKVWNIEAVGQALTKTSPSFDRLTQPPPPAQLSSYPGHSKDMATRKT